MWAGRATELQLDKLGGTGSSHTVHPDKAPQNGPFVSRKQTPWWLWPVLGRSARSAEHLSS